MEKQLFKNRTFEIEAYQITIELLESILFDDESYPDGLRFTIASYNKQHRKIWDWKGQVKDEKGREHIVEIGDWIITEDNGISYYPLGEDRFNELFERVVEVK